MRCASPSEVADFVRNSAAAASFRTVAQGVDAEWPFAQSLFVAR